MFTITHQVDSYAPTKAATESQPFAERIALALARYAGGDTIVTDGAGEVVYRATAEHDGRIDVRPDVDLESTMCGQCGRQMPHHSSEELHACGQAALAVLRGPR